MLYQVTTVLYETSRLNKVQLYMERSHLCKQHHLHGMCEHTRDCKQLYAAVFSFPFFQNVLHKQTTVNDDLVVSKSRY